MLKYFSCLLTKKIYIFAIAVNTVIITAEEQQIMLITFCRTFLCSFIDDIKKRCFPLYLLLWKIKYFASLKGRMYRPIIALHQKSKVMLGRDSIKYKYYGT